MDTTHFISFIPRGDHWKFSMSYTYLDDSDPSSFLFLEWIIRSPPPVANDFGRFSGICGSKPLQLSIRPCLFHQVALTSLILRWNRHEPQQMLSDSCLAIGILGVNVSFLEVVGCFWGIHFMRWWCLRARDVPTWNWDFRVCVKWYLHGIYNFPQGEVQRSTYSAKVDWNVYCK